MDFVDRCMDILRILAEDDPQARAFGLMFDDFVSATLANAPLPYGGPESVAAAIRDLERAGLVERNQGAFFRLTRPGRVAAGSPITAWQKILDIQLDGKSAEAMNAAARINPDGDDISFVALCEKLTWPYDATLLYGLLGELERDGMVEVSPSFADNSFRITFTGYVWSTRRHAAAKFRLITELIEEGENVNVDFKRELFVDTTDQKAEFIKDVTALANTQARGQRWMIVGLNDDGTYFRPPATTITTDRLQQVVNRYSSPPVPIRYEVIDHPTGQLGILEVARNPISLPYTFGKDMDGKTPRKKGEWFVRHSSHVEHPDDRERELIEQEAHRAAAKAQ